MEDLKMHKGSRELLKTVGVQDDVIELVERGYSIQFEEAKEAEIEARKAEEAKPAEPLSVLQMARKARVINPMKTEVSGSLLETARAARIIK